MATGQVFGFCNSSRMNTMRCRREDTGVLIRLYDTNHQHVRDAGGSILRGAGLALLTFGNKIHFVAADDP